MPCCRRSQIIAAFRRRGFGVMKPGGYFRCATVQFAEPYPAIYGA